MGNAWRGCIVLRSMVCYDRSAQDLCQSSSSELHGRKRHSTQHPSVNKCVGRLLDGDG